jgi:hypothetical protein
MELFGVCFAAHRGSLRRAIGFCALYNFITNSSDGSGLKPKSINIRLTAKNLILDF